MADRIASTARAFARRIVGITGLGIAFALCITTTSPASARVVPAVHPRTPSVPSSASTIVAAINAVRQSFGLPSGSATTAFQSQVVSAATQLRDPILKITSRAIILEDGVWGMVTSSDTAMLAPSEIVHLWVYEDGWRGKDTINIDCTSPKAPGCNAHRRAILQSAPERGAKLQIDAFASTKPIQGSFGLSIAAVLSWSK